MKIIDLLNKIANKEEVPMKIKLNNEIYSYTNDDYKTSNEKWLFSESYTDKTAWLDDFLRLEIEIIEEDKPRIDKVEMCTSGIMGFDGVENITYELKNKINELCDIINDMEKER